MSQSFDALVKRHRHIVLSGRANKEKFGKLSASDANWLYRRKCQDGWANFRAHYYWWCS